MSLGFKIYSFLNGKLVHQDSLGNKFYHDKSNIDKRWVIYASNFGPESIPTHYHNWLHGTSNELTDLDSTENELIANIQRRTKKHISTHKNNTDKGYSSWQPK